MSSQGKTSLIWNVSDVCDDLMLNGPSVPSCVDKRWPYLLCLCPTGFPSHLLLYLVPSVLLVVSSILYGRSKYSSTTENVSCLYAYQLGLLFLNTFIFLPNVFEFANISLSLYKFNFLYFLFASVDPLFSAYFCKLMFYLFIVRKPKSMSHMSLMYLLERNCHFTTTLLGFLDVILCCTH